MAMLAMPAESYSQKPESVNVSARFSPLPNS